MESIRALHQKSTNQKVLVTLAAGKYIQLLEMSRITFQSYAKKWGYDYVEVNSSLDDTRPYAWTKILAIRELLDDYDFVFYVDSDALILRDDTDIASIFNEDFAWPVGQLNGKYCPNAGVMAVRSCQSTKELFDLAYAQTDLIFNGWWEQAALMRVLQYEDPRDYEIHWSEFNLDNQKIEVFELDSSWNSTIEDFASNPVIRHFAGDPFTLKLALMAEYMLLRLSFNLTINLTSDEKQTSYKNYMIGKKAIFVSQITIQEKILRFIRRVWGKLRRIQGYKYE
jgi:hypothetical protein